MFDRCFAQEKREVEKLHEKRLEKVRGRSNASENNNAFIVLLLRFLVKVMRGRAVAEERLVKAQRVEMVNMLKQQDIEFKQHKKEQVAFAFVV